MFMIWSALMQCRLFVALSLTMIGPTMCRYWNHICMNTLQDMNCNYVMSILRGIAPQTIRSTVRRYEFRGINPIGKIKWHLCLWIYCQIWLASMWYQFHVALPLTMIGSTVSRYEFRGINHTVIIKWRIYEYTTGYDLQRCNINFVTLPLGSTASMFAF